MLKFLESSQYSIQPTWSEFSSILLLTRHKSKTLTDAKQDAQHSLTLFTLFTLYPPYPDTSWHILTYDTWYLKTLFKPSWFNPSWFKHSIHQKSVTWLTEPTVEMLIASKNQQQCLLVFSSPYFVHCLKEDCVKAGHSCNFFQCSQCK